MNITLNDFFPNSNTGLSQIGFLFGAGSSFAAGYPLTKELTISVLEELNPKEIKLIESILKEEQEDFDKSKGIPDIELLSDLLNKARITGAYSGVELLIDSIRKNIVDVINKIDNPNLKYHIKFLKGIKDLMKYRNESIWIFTTNYDMIFELAAAIVKIPICNGFEGIAERFYDVERFNIVSGKINTNCTFEPLKEPCIKLVKLHGSISWFENGNEIMESFSKERVDKRCMILPKRSKVIETLESPYDSLFRYASSIIGRHCKYIVTCGYSYRNDHINNILFTTKLKSNSLRVFALSKEETPEMLNFKEYYPFNYMTENKLHYNGNDFEGNYDLWDFKMFVELFNSKL